MGLVAAAVTPTATVDPLSTLAGIELALTGETDSTMPVLRRLAQLEQQTFGQQQGGAIMARMVQLRKFAAQLLRE